MLIHVGVNDIGNGAEPKELAGRIIELAARTRDNFRCPVYISAITPLQGLERKVHLCNEHLGEAARKTPGLIAINHANISTSHLVDDRHLATKGPMHCPTVRDLLVENFMKATTHKSLSLHEIKATYRNRFRGRQ